MSLIPYGVLHDSPFEKITDLRSSLWLFSSLSPDCSHPLRECRPSVAVYVGLSCGSLCNLLDPFYDPSFQYQLFIRQD